MSRRSRSRRLRCQGSPMTIAQSTHRNDSLFQWRSAERAGAMLERSAHMRPGAGFLPLRLPVARRSKPGYRIYSALDFFHGLDSDPFEERAAAVRAKARRTRTRVAWPLIVVAATTVVGALLVTANWHRGGRADGIGRPRVSPPGAARSGGAS